MISSLLKLASRIIAKRIEFTLVRSRMIPRTMFAYLKGKSTTDLVRSIRDVIDNSSLREDDKVAAIIQSDFSVAFDRVTQKHIVPNVRNLI